MAQYRTWLGSLPHRKETPYDPSPSDPTATLLPCPPSAVCLLLSAWLASSQAQVQTAIRPDGTLGTAVTQTGSLYEITGGKRPGNGPNLFHSFDRFRRRDRRHRTLHWPYWDREYSEPRHGWGAVHHRWTPAIGNSWGQFLSAQPERGAIWSQCQPGRQRVVSRQHGGLSAPRGWRRFSARLGGQSTLTVAPPVAFGFLGDNPAGISIQRSTLAVSEGRTISVVGGEVQMVGGSLRAPTGQIHLASVTVVGEVPSNLSESNAGTVPRLGAVALSQGARLDASSVQGGGTVVIRGGRLLMDNARIRVATEGDVNGAPTGVDVRVAGEMVLTNRAEITTDSGLFSSTANVGNAGAITLETGRLTLTDGAVINSTTFGTGHSGSVTVKASKALTLAGIDLMTGSPSGIFATARGVRRRRGGRRGHGVGRGSHRHTHRWGADWQQDLWIGA